MVDMSSRVLDDKQVNLRRLFVDPDVVAGSDDDLFQLMEKNADAPHKPELLVACGLCASKGEARKLIAAGGLYIGDEKLTDINAAITPEQPEGEGLLLRKGKKSYHRFKLA